MIKEPGAVGRFYLRRKGIEIEIAWYRRRDGMGCMGVRCRRLGRLLSRRRVRYFHLGVPLREY